MTKRQEHLAKRIRELTLAGVKQMHISRILHVSDPTVRKYQKLQSLFPRYVEPGEALHAALGIVDGTFGCELPFGPQYDVAVATAIVTMLSERYKLVYARATEENLKELCGLVTQALGVKRACFNDATVH
jgi:hypothetical protein